MNKLVAFGAEIAVSLSCIAKATGEYKQYMFASEHAYFWYIFAVWWGYEAAKVGAEMIREKTSKGPWG